MNPLPREVVDDALERVVSKTNLPGAFFLKLMKDLREAYVQYMQAFTSFQQSLLSNERAMTHALNEVAAAQEAQKKILQKEEKLAKAVDDAVAHALAISKGEPGKPGAPGAPGISPDPLKVAILAVRMIAKPQPGKNGESPALETIVNAVIESLMKEDRFGLEEKMKRIDNEVASYRSQLAGKHYGEDTWARGGGDTVVAGSGVAIEMDDNGNKVIRTTGSGAFTVETPVGAVDSVNTTYTVTTEPSWIIVDGVQYFEGAGYSYAALTITTDIAPSQFIRSVS